MVSIYQFSALLWIASAVHAQLNVKCGKPVGNVKGTITYTGDAVAVIAYSKGNKVCRFKEDTSTATFKLTVGYKAAPGIDCLFEKTASNLQNYGLRVETRKLHELLEGGDDDRFVVECVFTPVKPNIAVKVLLQQKYNPPKFVMKSSGIAAASTISIFLTDIINGRLTKPVAESQIIKIRSLMVSKKNEKGYQPIECTAESIDSTVKLLVLSDGCGTGFPWRYDQGFSMKGVNGDSPTFRMFRIKKNEGVIFKCTFVICPSACNENSCYLANVLKRRRRSAAKKFTRRTRGVQYNSLGLISHEKSKNVVGAGVLAAHEENEAPTDVEVNKDIGDANDSVVDMPAYNGKMDNQTENTNLFQDSNGYVEGTNDKSISGGNPGGPGNDKIDQQTENLFQETNGDVEGNNGNFVDINGKQTADSPGEISDGPGDEIDKQTENLSQDTNSDVEGTNDNFVDINGKLTTDSPDGTLEEPRDEMDRQISQDSPLNVAETSEPGFDKIDTQKANIPQDNPVDDGTSEPGYEKMDQTNNILQDKLGDETTNDNLQDDRSNGNKNASAEPNIHTVDLVGQAVHVDNGRSKGEKPTHTLEMGNGYRLGAHSANGDKKTKKINGGKITVLTDGKVKDIRVENDKTTN